jgi:hypothetical protein
MVEFTQPFVSSLLRPPLYSRGHVYLDGDELQGCSFCHSGLTLAMLDACAEGEAVGYVSSVFV